MTIQVIEKLLKDNNTMVLGSAVAAFMEVGATQLNSTCSFRTRLQGWRRTR